jgi:hypothetical protein
MYFPYVIIACIFILFLYFGYRDDYRRDKMGFKNTLFRIFGISFYLLFCYKIVESIEPFLKTTLMKFYPSEISLDGLKDKTSKEIEKTVAACRIYEGKIDQMVSTIEFLTFVIAFLLISRFILSFEKKKLSENTSDA